eukprot:Gb_16172 [translate_table: standard]
MTPEMTKRSFKDFHKLDVSVRGFERPICLERNRKGGRRVIAEVIGAHIRPWEVVEDTDITEDCGMSGRVTTHFCRSLRSDQLQEGFQTLEKPLWSCLARENCGKAYFPTMRITEGRSSYLSELSGVGKIMQNGKILSW